MLLQAAKLDFGRPGGRDCCEHAELSVANVQQNQQVERANKYEIQP